MVFFSQRLLLLYHLLTRSGSRNEELCGRQETDQETQRNSNIVDSDPVGVAHVRLASEGTGNSEVV